MKRRNRWNLVIILCLTVICFFVVKNIRTVSKITFDCIYFTFVKTLFPYENVFVVEKEKIVIKEPEKKEKEETIVDAAAKIIDRENLLNYDYVIKNFYVVQGSTSLSKDRLNLEKISNIDLTIEKNANEPQILIFHAHGQEWFADTKENGKTIVDVGEHLAEILRKQYGFNVLHITESYDLVDGVFDRAKAYDYANERLDVILKENPGIKVVIDLHRDGIDENRHLVTEINGKPTANVMLFNGISYSNEEGEQKEFANPYLEENLAMTYKMFLLGKIYYPEFFRCIYISDYRFCLYHVPRSMLIEAGAQTNTYEEVYNAMEPLAHLINLELTCK